MYLQSPLSTEYVRVAVAASDGSSPINVTSDPVALAFVSAGVQPVSGDFHTGSWETVGSTNYARLLVGPGGGAITLGLGLYDVYVKITDNPEAPVRKSGAIAIL